MPWRAAHALQARTDPRGPVLMASPVQLSRQAAVAELGQAALSDLGLTPLLNLASKLVCDVLGVEFSALARRSNDDESLVVVAGCGWDDTVGNGSTRLATDTGSCSEYVMRQQEPVFVHDFASDDRFVGQQFLLDHDIVSGVCVAILEGETSFGILGVYTSQRRTFTSDDGDFLRSIANIIGSAVRSYRVHGELEEHTIAQERRIRYQEAMATCAQTLLADRGEDRLETAIEALLTATQAASVFVERNVEDPELGLCSTTVADVAAADRPNEDLYSEYWEKVPWDKMPTSRSFLERGEPILLVPEQLEGVEGEFYAADPFPLKSELNIPIFTGDEWVGLIGFADSQVVRDWTDEDMSLLTTAATMIGAFWESELARESLEELVRSKDEFLATVSHELRTPLTAVVGFGEILRDAGDNFSQEEHAEFLERVVQQGTDLTNIVNDLLVAAKADIGKLHVAVVPINLRAQASQVFEAFDDDQVANVDLEGEAVYAIGDPDRVRQIIRNFISNALRYGGDTILVTIQSEEETAKVIVCDNGDPIPEDDRERIFEPYQRAHNAVGVTGSLGLGLAISRQLAQMMGGDVTYRYEGGESIFELALPRDASLRS